LDVDGRRIEMLRVNHIVPGVGYLVSSRSGHNLAFSGDTSTQDHFWDELNKRNKLDYLIVEAAFSNEELELSQKAGHYAPVTLAADMKKLNHDPKIYISHTKPGQEALIVKQCQDLMPERNIHRLMGGEVFTL